MKTCENCKKPIKGFNKIKRFCSNVCQAKTWNKNHPDRCREAQKRYEKKHSKDLKIRFRVLSRDNFTCQYCGRKSPQVILHIDHIVPLSRGGKTNEDNLVTACFDCNIGKSDSLLNNN